MHVCMYACIDQQRSSSKKQLQLQLQQRPTIDHSKKNLDAVISAHYACNYMAAFHGTVGRAHSFSLLSFVDIVSPSPVTARAFLGSDGRKPLPCFQRCRFNRDNHAVFLSPPDDATAVSGDGSDTGRAGSQGPRCRSWPRTQGHHLHRRILRRAEEGWNFESSEPGIVSLSKQVYLELLLLAPSKRRR